MECGEDDQFNFNGDRVLQQEFSRLASIWRVCSRLLALALASLLISCGGDSSSDNADCTVASSPFPVTASDAVAAPSDIDFFYAAIYSAAADAAADAGVANPLIAPNDLPLGYNQYYAAAVGAYVWGLPAEQFWEKQGSFFVNFDPSIPINSLFLADEIDTGSSIVSPNTEVLYANGFVDLSTHPHLITYPQSSTYNVLQIMDAFTNVQGTVGSRVNTCGSVVLYYANASYAEAVQAAYPNNALAIYTPQAWALARVEVDAYAVTTEDGIPQTLYQTLSGSASSALALWKSQNVLSQYSLSALTDYANTNGGSVQQSSAPTADSYTQFFTNLAAAVGQNQLLVNYAGVQNGILNLNSNVYDQSAMFSKFLMIGLSRGSFSDSALTLGQRTAISTGYADAMSAIRLIASDVDAPEANNYWQIGADVGHYKPGYGGWIAAAVVATVGLGANLPADGTYPRLTVDSNNTDLTGTGGNSYSLDFSSTGIPPITSNNGFWSVSVYDSSDNLYKSTKNTYYYTSQVGGLYDLGSNQLDSSSGIPTLLFQNSAPANSDLLASWIPVPAGVFTVLMRLYNPVAANINGVSTILNPYNGVSDANSPRWIPPPILKN